MSKSSRTKGHAFERHVAQEFRKIFPKARRHLEYQDGECYGVDIANTGRYRIQCKKLKKYASVSTISEVVYSTEEGQVPVLITAGDNLAPMAVLPLEDLLRLISVDETWDALG